MLKRVSKSVKKYAVALVMLAVFFTQSVSSFAASVQLLAVDAEI